MEGYEMAYAKPREYSGGQPKYRVEIYYDGQGVCYFHDGWSKFFIDYGVHEGWFLLLTRHNGKKDFTVCLFDGTLSARTFAAWSCRADFVDLQRGLLRGKVHAALAPGRARRASPGQGAFGTLRVAI
jgi:hypothetical protein